MNKIIELIIPPIFFKLKKSKTQNLKTYKDYESAVQESSTYENNELVKVIASKGLHFKNSLNLLDYKNLTHIGSEQINKLLSLISLCEIKDNNINILDFGGGAGHHYFLLKKLLNENITVNWIVFETEELVKECIANGLETDELKFSSSFESNLLQDLEFDVLYANYSLAYTNDPYLYLQKLLELNFKNFTSPTLH